jgi:hypothetical protein
MPIHRQFVRKRASLAPTEAGWSHELEFAAPRLPTLINDLNHHVKNNIKGT